MTLAQPDGIAFRELSFANALKMAKEENKLLFVDCFTTWCGPCRMLSKVVLKILWLPITSTAILSI